MPVVTTMENMTREEWVTWYWESVPQRIGDPDRMLMRSYRRTPDEVARAVQEWEIYMKEIAGYMPEMEEGREPHEA